LAEVVAVVVVEQISTPTEQQIAPVTQVVVALMQITQQLQHQSMELAVHLAPEALVQHLVLVVAVVQEAQVFHVQQAVLVESAY
jgi:hypothetical protein